MVETEKTEGMTVKLAIGIVFEGPSNPRYQEAVELIKSNPQAHQIYMQTAKEMGIKADIELDEAAAKTAQPKTPKKDSKLDAVAPSAPASAMSAKEAYDILVNSDKSHPDYAVALRVIQGDAALMAEYKKFLENQQKEKEEFSLVKKMEDLANTYESNRERLQTYSKEYKVNIYGKRTRNGQGKADANDKTPSHWTYIKNVVDIYATDDDGKTVVDDKGSPVLLTPEEKNEWMSLVFKKAKDAAYIELLTDEKFAKLSDDEAMKLFRDKTDENVQEELAEAVVATAVKLPENSEVQVGSPKFFEQVAESSDGAKKMLNEFIEALKAIDAEEIEDRIKNKTKEQIQKIKKIYAEKRDAVLKKYKGKFGINPTMILFSTSHLATEEERIAKEFFNAADDAQKRAEKATSEKVKAKYAEIKEKFNATGKYINERIKGLEKQAEDVSKGKYFRWVKPTIVKIVEKVKPVVEEAPKAIIKGFKVNRGQMAVDALASFALSASGFGAAALGLYGGLMAARGWVAPVWAEAREMKLKSKEEGQKPLSFVKRLKAASAKLKDTEKYNRKGWMTTALSAAVFVPLATAAALSGGALPVLGAAALMPVIKAGISTLVQSNETVHAYAAYRKNKEDENLKKAFKAERRGLAWGLVASVAGQFLGAKLRGIFNHDNPETNIAGEPRTPTPTVPAEQPQTDTVVTQPADTLGTEPQVEPDPKPEPQQETVVPEGPVVPHFPKEWNKEMGISYKQFTTLLKKMEGSLVDAEGKNVTLDRAYQNLTDEIMKKHFNGFTREQVLYRYNRLSVFDRTARDLGEFLRENPEGKPFSKYNSQLEPLMRLLGCGEEPTEEQSAGIRILLNEKNFDEILSKGTRNVEDTGSTLADGCEANRFKWRKIVQVIKKAAEEQPKEPVTPVAPRMAQPILETKAGGLVGEPPAPVTPMPEQEVSIGVVNSSTGDAESAYTGEGTIVQKDVTTTKSGKNIINANGYDVITDIITKMYDGYK